MTRTISRQDLQVRIEGYANVGVYAEGKQDWIEAGLAIEAGQPPARAD